jgi:DNA-binding transcriptional MerR regulator
MPIAQIRHYAALRAEGALTNAARMSLLEEHQARLHEQIVLLRRHEKAIAAKITTYRADLATNDQPPTTGAEDNE